MFTTVWTEEKVDYLLRHYSNTANAEIVAATGVSERTIQRKAKALGLVKDPAYIAGISRDGLMQIEYLRLTGHKMGPPKGLRCNPKGEFKPGHKESKVTRALRIASLRARSESEHQRIARGLKPNTRWNLKTKWQEKT